MHFAGLLPEIKRSCRYILLSIEHLTVLVNARATSRRTAEIAISVFRKETIKQFGGRSVVLAEHGSDFLLAAWKKKLKLKRAYDRVTAV